MKKALEEIKKCILVCHNCHFEIHEGMHRKYLTVDKTTKHYMTIKKREQKQKAVTYLGGCCKNCGYNKCNRSLTFHHIDKDKKEIKIGSESRIYSWEELEKELNKCILLCMNCHGEKHYEN